MASFSAAPSNFTNVTNDANFRAWGLYLSQQLTAVGLTKTADTGQVDWTTALNPGGTSTYLSYEIRTFTDALQATAPVYFKIEYGEGTAADGPGVRVSFGTGSNGSGTLTGNVSTARTANGNSNASTCIIVGSGDTSRFCFAGGYNTGANLGMCFSFERMKNAAGEDTTEGVMWSAHSTGVASSTATVNQSTLWNSALGNYGLVETNFLALFPVGATMKTVTQTMVQPIFHNKGVYTNPQLGIVGFYTEDITINGVFSAYMYGVSHVYWALPSTAFATGGGFAGPGGGTESIGIRYE